MDNAAEHDHPRFVDFGPFTLDLHRRSLCQAGESVRITPKPFETLVFLIEHSGRNVRKQEILDAVWKDTFVTEDTLVQAIRELRRVLGDDKRDPRFIRTIPRYGYRFVCPVHPRDEIAGGNVPWETTPQIRTPAIRPNTKVLRTLWVAMPLSLVVFVLALVYGPPEFAPAPEHPWIGAFTQITSGEFNSAKPSFSQDGRLILYVSSSEETRQSGDLFIRQFPEGSARRITTRMNPSGDIPVFSWDGRHIVFSLPRLDQDRRHHDLWMVPTLGGPERRFITDASGAGFSPDGKWVAYTKHSSANNPLWLSPLGDLQQHTEVMAEGFTPRWSPDGRWMAFTTSNPNGGAGDIWKCRISQLPDGRGIVSPPERITRDDAQLYGLTWTADSQSIIFASKRGGSTQLYRVAVSGGGIESLLGGVGQYEAPSASPDGRALVFSHYRLTHDLIRIDLASEGAKENLTHGEFRRWPRLSPSGRKVVSVLRDLDDTERLYLTDLQSKEHSRLSDRQARHPSWLDEENVVFLAGNPSGPGTEVIALNIAMREARLLTAFPGEVNWPAIHPDRNRIAAVTQSESGNERILLRDLATRTDQTMHDGLEYEYLRWSPDGSVLAWSRPGRSRNSPETSGGIWLMPNDQREPMQITRDGYCPVWDGSGTALYFSLRSGQRGIVRYSLAMKETQMIRRWESIFSCDVVGTQVVLAEANSEGQIYALALTGKRR